MARKQHHEEHANHEAWAIPYGDLVTLLLAFFVVMYAVSSVNEGKYRVLSESLQSAFKGPPRSLSPVQLGEQIRSLNSGSNSGMDPQQSVPQTASPTFKTGQAGGLSAELQEVSDELEAAMRDLIDADTVILNRTGRWIEVEIKNDILFPTGSSAIDSDATEIIQRFAEILAPLPNPLRVEGHTDNRPISTKVFPSNWELSAARAATLVRSFEAAGVDPARMSVAGMGEHQPVADNETAAGRLRNRRVALVILEAPALADTAVQAGGLPAQVPDAPAAAAATPEGAEVSL